jgi:hypothetical protein
MVSAFWSLVPAVAAHYPNLGYILSRAVDPGTVKTNIMRELPSWLEVVAHFVLTILGLLQQPQTGAAAVIDAALAPKVSNILLDFRMSMQSCGWIEVFNWVFIFMECLRFLCMTLYLDWLSSRPLCLQMYCNPIDRFLFSPRQKKLKTGEPISPIHGTVFAPRPWIPNLKWEVCKATELSL